MMQVILYSRENCHLCHQTQADLESLQADFPHTLKVVDIDASPALQRRYGELIPVVEVGAFTLKAPISPLELRRTLELVEQAEAAAPSSREVPTAGESAASRYRTSATWTRSDSLTYWLSRHWLALVNLLVGLYVFMPFLAPTLMQAGLERPAGWIYRVYGGTCHQLAYRSIFLFGEQIFYPRTQAGVDELLTFGQATGIGEGNSSQEVFAARNFIGDPQIGYKVALCQRDIALYGSILLFGLVYGATRRRIPALAWYWWLLFGILPVGIDGLSQLLSQPPFNFLPYRESTPWLRILSGALFGWMTAWFGYPVIGESMRDTEEMMETKWHKTHARTTQALQVMDSSSEVRHD